MTFPSGGQDDVAFRAYVQDFTTDFFDRFDANVDKMAVTAEEGFSNIDDNIQKSGAAWGALGGLVSAISLKVIDSLYGMVQGAVSFAQVSISLAARVDTLGITLQQMGNRAGYTNEQLAEYEEQLKSTGITTQAARASMTRMIRANIDLAEAAKLARIAQDSAVVAGINSSAAFERLVVGIQKREPEMLDELGLTLDRADAYDKLAASVGKTAEQLSEAEQQQAILNSIYKQAEVVAGVYDAAMGSVGKQVTSTARYVEELQLALGRAFQPAYQAWVEFMQASIKELSEWFKENEDAVMKFGEQFGKVFMAALDLATKLKDTIAAIPGVVVNAGVALGELVAYLAEGEEGVEKVKSNTENLGLYFKQLLTIIAGGINVIYENIAGAIRFISASVKTTMAVIKNDVEGIAAGIAEMDAAVLSTIGMENIQRQFDEGFQSAGEFFGLLETADTSNAETQVRNVGDAIVDLSAAMASAERDMMELMEQFQMEMAQEALNEARRLQEQAINLAHRMEDIQRNHADSIARIMEQANYTKENAVKNYEDTRLSIVRDYHRRLLALQRDFEFEADELARKRDAVGLLRLIRANERKLEEEKEGRDDRMDDTERDFQDRLKMIDEQTQRQIEAAEKQRQSAIESLQRQLDRERELRELHDQWEMEDRRDKYQKLVQELVERYANEEGLTAEHVSRLLQMWSDFYTNEAQMMMDYEQWKAQAIGRIAPGVNPVGGSSEYELRRAGIIGQGGQVSRSLGAPVTVNVPSDFSRGSVPRIPVVAPSTSTDRRELIVKVEGNALEPVIQRQLVASLIEVERNRGT